MENHKRSKKHAENVSRLLQELGDDDKECKKDDDDVDDGEEKLSAADGDDVEVDDDLPDLSQSRYYTRLLLFSFVLVIISSEIKISGILLDRKC